MVRNLHTFVDAITMKLLFVGDIVLDRQIAFSDEFLEFARSHDYQIANFEAPIRGNGSPIPKAGVHIQSDPRFLPSLRRAFNVLTVANNHTMDFGPKGLSSMKFAFQAHEFLTAGSGTTIDEAFTPLQLGNAYLFAVCENEFGGVTYESPGVAVFDHLRVLHSKIQEYKQKGPVIVCYHGGSEIIPIPQSYLRDRFQMLRDFGASLVIGHHPHVVQGYENNIFYSLGNFFCEGGKFSQYENSEWALCVSYDTETNAYELRHVKTTNGTLEFTDKTEKLNALNSLIQSPDYHKISDQISKELCIRWYLNNPTNQTAIWLHYFRCDAHRHNYSVGLSALHGETDAMSKQHDISITHTDSFHIGFKK